MIEEEIIKLRKSIDLLISVIKEHSFYTLEKKRKLFSVSEWCETHVWPKEGGLRSLIFNEKSNGFSICIRRIGRKVYIDEDKFFEWVDKKNE